ncbi:MAG: ABC transporter ATP-binding protein/permease [Candidatus Dormibacteraeota bacterium]|nr:ABC transporter ATP-binding protein/permease [Candidatus Dormibacteraeota bacterium]
MIFLSRMVTITRGHRGLLGIAIAGSILATALSVVPALIIRQVLVTVGQKGGSSGTILWLGLAMVAATAAIAVARYFEGGFGHNAAFKILHDVRMRCYEQMLRLSMGFHTKQQSGAMAARIIGDVETIEFFTAHAGIQLISAALVPVFIGILMLAVNWRLGLIALAPLLLIIAVLTLFREAANAAFKRSRDELGRMNGLMVDHIQGVGVLKAFAAAAQARRAIDDRSRRLAEAETRANLLHTWYFAGVEWLAAVPVALVLLTGGLMVLSGQLSAPNLILFVFLTTYLYRPITDLNRQLEGLRTAQAATERIYEILTAPIEVADVPAARVPAAPAYDVRLDAVTFAYEPGRPVLHDVSIELREGQVLALVGPSGAGKTTVANLIARFWDPQEGAVRLGGIDVRELPLDYVHRSIGLVLQDVFLFNDTVAANIKISDPDADDARLESAARAAYAHEFITELPNGYETIIGERGVRLSGGQKQRISIARALLRDAPILILDEATSSVDPEAEHLIQLALARLVADRTVLVIAHRLSTIRQASEIVVLERGRVVQRGRHDELVDAPGLYANLYRAQQVARRWDVAGSQRGDEALAQAVE